MKKPVHKRLYVDSVGVVYLKLNIIGEDGKKVTKLRDGPISDWAVFARPGDDPAKVIAENNAALAKDGIGPISDEDAEAFIAYCKGCQCPKITAKYAALCAVRNGVNESKLTPDQLLDLAEKEQEAFADLQSTFDSERKRKIAERLKSEKAERKAVMKRARDTIKAEAAL